jgi:hypothetical protein
VHIQALNLTNYLLHRSSFRVEWAPVYLLFSFDVAAASEQVAAGRSTHVAMESRRELAVWQTNLVCVVVVM